MRRRTRLILATMIFALSFATKALHSVDLAPLMYTSEEPLGALADAYDQRASSILNGEGLLGPYESDPSITASLARAPGYPIFLSLIYSTGGRDYFKVQYIQNALNSLSPVLIFMIAGSLMSWRVGAVSGALSALSHHLSYMSNWILPDSVSPLLLLSAVGFLVTARRNRRYSYVLYALAGVMIGLCAWLRSLTMLMGPFLILVLAIIAVQRGPAIKRAAVLCLSSFLVIAPITIRNYVVHGKFVPINIQMGLVMWVGIADASGDRFGAVADDNEVAKQEAIIYNKPSYGGDWSSPDGIERDRERIKKSLDVIVTHPVWYAGVMLDRMGEMLKYSAHAPLVFKDERPGSVDGAVSTREPWRNVTPQTSILSFGRAISWLRAPIRALQRITKESMILFILLGAAATCVASSRRALFLLAVPIYHLLLQSFMHTEFRYGLAIHYFLFVFAATAWILIVSALWRGLKLLGGRRQDQTSA